jgi:membrane protein DedA with SNARE-associated domain
LGSGNKLGTIETFSESFIANWGLIAVFLLMVANGFFSTPPSELVISLTGTIVATSSVSIYAALVIVVCGHFIGTTIWFILGWYLGAPLLQRIKNVKFVRNHPKLDNFIPTTTMLDAICNKFRESGTKWVFIFRFLPFVRSAISIPAGIARISIPKYIVYTISGDIIWSLLWLILGFYLGDEYYHGKPIVTITLTITMLVILMYIGYRVRKWLANVNVQKTLE